MRRSTIAVLLMAATVASGVPAVPSVALAQDAAKPTIAPMLSIDPAQLPPLPRVVPAGRQEQMILVATGAGAAITVILVDVISGGLLLAPLGVTGSGSLFGFGGGAAPLSAAAAAAAAAAVPVYTVSQRLISGIVTIAIAWGGGYLGGHLASTHPELLGLQ